MNGEDGVTVEAGPQVGPNTLAAILCDGVVEATARTPGSIPLALGRRRRLIPPRFRRFILHRDGGVCTISGCVSRHRLQVHHVTRWSKGGRTEPENLCTVCWFHHYGVIHGQGFTIDPTSPPQRRRPTRPRIHAPPRRRSWRVALTDLRLSHAAESALGDQAEKMNPSQLSDWRLATGDFAGRYRLRSMSEQSSTRAVNFSAGPSVLPVSVLEEIKAEIVDYRSAGMSMIEMSHRSAPYDAVHQGATDLVRRLLSVPDEFDVLFIQGGATMQFGMLPMNPLADGSLGAYVDTGAWALKAIEDGSHHGDTYVAWSGQGTGYSRIPTTSEIELRENSRYLHITSNETIGGIQYQNWPDVVVPLAADMSSDIMSRPIPWERFDVVYGGVQKNLAPAGLALVIIRRGALEHTDRDLASYLRYDVHASKGSMYNTPPVFPIYVMEKVLRWVDERGGLAAMEAAAEERSALLYAAIDDSDGFYVNPVEPDSRSKMNVVFRLADERLEAPFIAAAAERGMVGLTGHRSVGGCRASLYNAMPLAGVEALCALMADFAGTAS